jgi:transcriptional regulator with XRE-family HTH domain
MLVKRVNNLYVNFMDTAIFVDGARIRALRQRSGLTQARLASEAKLSRSLVAQVETNRANPSLSALHSLSGALDVQPSDLLDLTRKMIADVFEQIAPDTIAVRDTAEAQLITAYRRLSSDDAAALLQIAQSLAKGRGPAK